jgi:hypothetical protein
LFSGDILERDNADHSLFPSQHGQLAEISFTHQLFRFSDGLVFKAIARFLIQFRLREFDLRNGETARQCPSETLNTNVFARFRSQIDSWRPAAPFSQRGCAGTRSFPLHL